jgi:hypothetical protein
VLKLAQWLAQKPVQKWGQKQAQKWALQQVVIL